MIENLVEHFAALESPRCAGKIEHLGRSRASPVLVDVLVIAVCAVVAEAETFEDIALYGRCRKAGCAASWSCPAASPHTIRSAAC